MKDYYEILLVPRDAAEEDIKKAYRKLAMEYHPDRNPRREKWATERFKEIHEAFSILGDPEKRRQYDQFGGEGDIGDILRHPSTRTTFEGLRNDFDKSGLGFDFLDVILGDYLKGADSPAKTFGRGFKGPEGLKPEASTGISLEDIFGQARPPRQDVQYEMIISREQAARGLEKEIIHKGKRLMVRIPAGVRDGSKVILRDGRHLADGEPVDIIILVRVP